MSAPRFFVCGECLAGFREDARDMFEAIGKVKPGTNECACGGEFALMDADSAVGEGGALDTMARRRRDHKPN